MPVGTMLDAVHTDPQITAEILHYLWGWYIDVDPYTSLPLGIKSAADQQNGIGNYALEG